MFVGVTVGVVVFVGVSVGVVVFVGVSVGVVVGVGVGIGGIYVNTAFAIAFTLKFPLFTLIDII